jgi:hypothetical protein
MLALGSGALAVQLSGEVGRTTLENVANNTFNQTFPAKAPESLGEPSGGAVLNQVSGILNQSFSTAKMPPANPSEPSGGAVLANVNNILNRSFNATEKAPENVSKPSGGALPENVTNILNQTFSAAEIAPENPSIPSGGAAMEKAANETGNQTPTSSAAAKNNLSGGLGKSILNKLKANQTSTSS